MFSRTNVSGQTIGSAALHRSTSTLNDFAHSLCLCRRLRQHLALSHARCRNAKAGARSAYVEAPWVGSFQVAVRPRPCVYGGVGQAAPPRVFENPPGPVVVAEMLEVLSLLLVANMLMTALAFPVPPLYEGPV